jgi:RNA-directed DNA polymerase
MAKTENLIHLLNPKIRGWANHFRYSCAKKTFSYIDHHIHKALWDWSCRRHPGKGASWIKRKYYRSQGLRNWIFFAKTVKDDVTDEYVDLFIASSVAIKRHVKIKAEATPYDPRFTEYFSKRERGSTRSCLK